MTNNNYTTTKNAFKHQTDIQRDRLVEMKKSGNLEQVQIATELGVIQSTELKLRVHSVGPSVYNYQKEHSDRCAPCRKTVYTLICFHLGRHSK